MGDLVCVTIFSQTSGERIFSSIYAPGENFFSVKEFFPRFWFSFKIFSLEISLQGIFILKSSLPLPAPFPQKANGRPLTDNFHMFLLWCLIRVKSTLLSQWGNLSTITQRGFCSVKIKIENEQDLQPTLRITSTAPFFLISDHLTFFLSLYFSRLSKESVYGYKIAPINRHWSNLFFFLEKNWGPISTEKAHADKMALLLAYLFMPFIFQRALISALSSVEDLSSLSWWNVRVYFFN